MPATDIPSPQQHLKNMNVSSKDVDHFHRFPDLPKEIRLIIFGFAASIPRIVEVIGNCETHQNSYNDHSSYCIAIHSRKAPAILHVSSESRAEAKRFYEKRFQHMYFNPIVDILLIGESACSAAMTRVFNIEGRFPRVAFLIKDRGETNCRGPEMIMQDLHGDIRSSTNGTDSSFNYRSGCRGLKEVFFFLRSDVWDSLIVDEKVTFRPAVLNGRTPQASNTKSKFTNEIQRHRNGTNLSSNGNITISGDKWFGRHRPSFQFVNLAPLSSTKCPHVLDSIAMNRYSYDELTARLTQVDMEAFHRRNKWSILLGRHSIWGSRVELGLYGDKDAIEKGQKEIRDQIRAIILEGGRRRNVG